MKTKIQELFKSSVFIFILVGGCSTGIDFVIYMLLSCKLQITISKGISMIVASIFSYFVNKQVTFNNREKTNLRYIFRYYLVFAINFGTNLGINYLIYHYLGTKIIAFVLATICGMTVNYLGQKYFVFPNADNK